MGPSGSQLDLLMHLWSATGWLGSSADLGWACSSVWGVGWLLARKKKNFPVGSDSKASAYNAGDPGSIPGLGDPLEKEMATHSSILAWGILRTEEPGRL